MEKINQTQVRALKSWAGQVKTIVAKTTTLQHKIEELQEEINLYNKQIEAYDKLIPTVFNKAFPEDIKLTDLVTFTKVEGANLIQFNPEYIQTYTEKVTDKNGRVSNKYTYYLNKDRKSVDENQDSIAESVDDSVLFEVED